MSHDTLNNTLQLYVKWIICDGTMQWNEEY
jgi:hypothetical protein